MTKAIPREEPAIEGEQLALTRYIPWLLQTVLLLIVLPYLSLGQITDPGQLRDRVLFAALLLLCLAALKAGRQNVVTGLVFADTVVVSICSCL